MIPLRLSPGGASFPDKRVDRRANFGRGGGRTGSTSEEGKGSVEGGLLGKIFEALGKLFSLIFSTNFLGEV
jgi:hypothetical protein